MSENNATGPVEMTPTERWQAEQARLATPEGAQGAVERARVERVESVERNLRNAWGPHESDFLRGLAANDLAAERLGLSDEERDELERWVGPEDAAEIGRRAGEALSLIDPEMTAAEARVRVRELQRTPGFLRTLETDERARKEWDALTTRAARPR